MSVAGCDSVRVRVSREIDFYCFCFKQLWPRWILCARMKQNKQWNQCITAVIGNELYCSFAVTNAFKTSISFLMEVSFLSILSIILINECTARTSSITSASGSSSKYALYLGLIIPIVAICLITIVISILCKLKRSNQARMGISPLAAQLALQEHNNPYAPPGHRVPPPSYRVPPPDQPPVGEDLPPSYSSIAAQKGLAISSVTS